MTAMFVRTAKPLLVKEILSSSSLVPKSKVFLKTRKRKNGQTQPPDLLANKNLLLE